MSGLKVISYTEFTRRNRIVLTAGLCFGLGSELVPDYANYIFTYSGSNAALQGFINSIVIVLQTPFLIAAIISIALNLILPDDDDDVPVKQTNEEIEEGTAQPVLTRAEGAKDYSDDDIKGSPQ